MAEQLREDNYRGVSRILNEQCSYESGKVKKRTRLLNPDPARFSENTAYTTSAEITLQAGSKSKEKDWISKTESIKK